MLMPIYGNLCTQFYDLDKPEPPSDALAFYLRHLEAAQGPALEAMCGSGRFLIPLLERGIQIEGMDASASMLEACRARGAQKGLAPGIYQQLLQELSLPQRYGCVILPGGSFGFVVEEEDVAESLVRLYRHLLPAGQLVLEVLTPAARATSPGRWITRPDGARIVENTLHARYDSAANLEHFTLAYELFKGGRMVEEEREEYTLRHYEPEEFALLLAAAGFADIGVTQAYEDTPPQDDDILVVFTCRKPE